MKIAIISSGIVSINTFLKEQIKFLVNKYNAKITIITNVGSNEELYPELKNLNIKIINISFKRKPNIFIDILTLLHLAILLKKSNFDMTITITPKAGFLGTLASFIKRIPIRIHIFTGQVWVNKRGFLRFFLKLADKIIYRLSTKTLIDSIYISVVDIDTILIDKQQFPIYSFQDSNEFYSISGSVSPKEALLKEISFINNITFSQRWERKNILAKKTYFVEVKNSNPYVTIYGVQNYQIQDHRRFWEQGKFWFAIGTGVGILITR